MRQMITLTEYARKVGHTRSWVHILILQGRIPGAKKVQHPGTRNGGIWMIPANAKIKELR